jgi:hypothetical protein
MAISGLTVPKLGTVVAPISISGTTARSAAISTGLIRIYASTDCFIKFGDSSVTATTSDHFLLGGSVYDLSYSGTNFAAITSGSTGTIYASELV